MKPIKIGNHTFDWGARTYVMGILNITPDSFSGDGILASPRGNQSGTEQAANFLSLGADILDVGGESTRPGSAPVSAQTEAERVIPIIKELTKKFPEAIISIDTYKASVADEALNAGAHILNAVWGLRADPALAGVAAKHNAPVILMHNRSNPASVELREQLGNSYSG